MKLLRHLQRTFAFIRQAFSGVFVKTNFDEDVDMLSRKVCARFAEGNVSLAQGKFVTSQDIERKKKALAGYFS